MKRYLNKREKQQVLITEFAMKMFTELFTIAEYALDAKCKTCHLRGHEVDACELRCSLIEFGVPYAREDVTEGCPFRLEAD